MNYQETLTYLYECVPMFQQVGSSAYKEGLDNTLALDEYLGHPHRQFKTIHVAGTNGKGSCSHTLAAILQAAGYRTGLYTSPHLIDFRERIRVNGETVSKAFVVDFVERNRHFFEPLHPSFFELTTAMAFTYFAQQQVDVAIIEVGMGGRLDCTNIIHPELCLITNISFDHTQFLGNTLGKIAQEKAGIFKPGVPVVIGETTPETRAVFEQHAKDTGTSVFFAEDEHLLQESRKQPGGGWIYQTKPYADLQGELGGFCQQKNTNTLLSALKLLPERGFQFDETNVRKGFAHVAALTGLMGRWQQLQEHPTLICDTGHNTGGIQYIVEQLKYCMQTHRKLHIVMGMVNDKDVNGMLALLPADATYYFTHAQVKRALPEGQLQQLAARAGLKGTCHPSVPEAVKAARQAAGPDDFIFVGGSSFIVADLLTNWHDELQKA